MTKSHRNPRGSFYLTQEPGIGLSKAMSELTGDISARGCSHGSALPQQPGAPPGGQAAWESRASQASLSLSGSEVTPRSPWGASHTSLARTASRDAHNYRGCWDNGNMAAQQRRAVRREQHGCRVDNPLCRTHRLLRAECVPSSNKRCVLKPHSPILGVSLL